MSRPFLLALVIVVVAAVAGEGLLLSTDEDGSESALSPTQTLNTATPIPLPTPWMLPGQPPPIPTPDHRRNVPEVTLVDTQNGGTIPLWEPGYRIHEVVFQSDWLYYVRFPVATGVVDAEIMAFSLESHQSAYKLADGYNIAISVYGDIAYTVRHADGTDSGATLDRFWRPGPPPGGAGRFAWSPDGRWLTSSGGYLEYGVPIPQYILDYDFRTARVRQFAETLPCNCDGGPGVNWAPDSARFQLTRLVGAADLVERASDIYEPWGLTRFQTTNFHGWISPSKYIEQDNFESGNYAIYDFLRGVRVAIERLAFHSPERSVIATIPDVTQQAFNVRGADGTMITSGLQGLPDGFSSDGRFVLAGSGSVECPGLNVYRVADGERLYCRTFGRGSFSPDSTRLAVVVGQPPHPLPSHASELWITDLKTGTERRLASDLRGGLGCAYWSPDSRYVVVAFCPGV